MGSSFSDSGVFAEPHGMGSQNPAQFFDAEDPVGILEVVVNGATELRIESLC